MLTVNLLRNAFKILVIVIVLIRFKLNQANTLTLVAIALANVVADRNMTEPKCNFKGTYLYLSKFRISPV